MNNLSTDGETPEKKDGQAKPRQFHLHLVSDATGETVISVAKAVAIQFDAAEPIQHAWPFVRSRSQVDKVIGALDERPGLVLFTLVDPDLRDYLQEGCRRLGAPAISILDPVIAQFAQYLGVESSGQPGLQHEMDREYFARIDAMNFTLAHDDGQEVVDLHHADIILVGVSRTSKTPTAIYLANRGLKVANIPLVPGIDPPAELEGLTRPLIVGLTARPEHLTHIRSSRMRFLNQSGKTGYTDLETVRDEVRRARQYFQRQDWPIIDVTRRSIEETAATVLNLYHSREDEDGTPL